MSRTRASFAAGRALRTAFVVGLFGFAFAAVSGNWGVFLLSTVVSCGFFTVSVLLAVAAFLAGRIER